jgi:orotidine-5'-phosphate decarboxylase
VKAPIVLAVDTPDLEIAKRWVSLTEPFVSVFKLGLEFFLTFGHEGVKAIKNETDAEIFLDLKLHDIPHTVSGAASAIASLAPTYLTVHASGGSAMIRAAVEATPHTRITAVTILTSLSEEDLSSIGFADSALTSAVTLADMAVKSGATALVCSPLEISAIRSTVGQNPLIITPGVRPLSEQGADDQKRTMTPREAIEQGASLVVIGRPITKEWLKGAEEMVSKARVIAQEMMN